MKNRKLLLQMLVTFLITSCVMLALNIIAYGMPVFGKPKPEQVSRVVVEDMENHVTEELTDPEDIDLACKLVNFMNYVPFAKVNACQDPVITVTYILSDGSELTAGANNYNYTCWWNGEMHKLKDDTAFVTITRGVCFPMHYDTLNKQSD